MKVRNFAAFGSLALLMACTASPMLSPTRGVYEAETTYRAIEASIDELNFEGLSGKAVKVRFNSLSNTPGGVGWIGGYAPLRDASVNFGQSTVTSTGTRTNSGSGTANFSGPLGIPNLSQSSTLAPNENDIAYAKQRILEKMEMAGVQVFTEEVGCGEVECISAFVKINLSGEPQRQDFIFKAKDSFISRAKIEVLALDKCGKQVFSDRRGKTVSSSKEYIFYISIDNDMPVVSVDDYSFQPERANTRRHSAGNCG